MKKIGEHWSTNNVSSSNVYLPKIIFFKDHISAPRECCSLKFLHVLQNDQGLLNHDIRDRGPPYNFLTIINIQKLVHNLTWCILANNFGSSGNNIAKRSRDTPRGRDKKLDTNFWGPALKNVRGQKRAKFGAVSDNFRL